MSRLRWMADPNIFNYDILKVVSTFPTMTSTIWYILVVVAAFIVILN